MAENEESKTEGNEIIQDNNNNEPNNAQEESKEIKEDNKEPVKPAAPTNEKTEQSKKAPEIQLKVQTSKEEAAQKKFVDVVQTVLVIKNWLLNRQEDEDQKKTEDAQKESSNNDPFLKNFAVTAAESEEQASDQAEAKTLLAKFIRKHFLRPITTDKTSHYYWSGIVALAILYNWIFIIARTTFDNLQSEYEQLWFIVDYVSDAIYIIDMICEAKKGYLEEGLLVTNPKKLLMHYVRSSNFFVDVISIFPTDLLYFALTTNEPWIRVNRIVRVRRLNEFSDRTETRSNWPNAFRIFKMFLIIFILFHWNACVFFEISKAYGIDSDEWVFRYDKIDDVLYNCVKLDISYLNEPNTDFRNFSIIIHNHEDGRVINNRTMMSCKIMMFSKLSKQYLLSFYFSALTLATIGNQPVPQQDLQFVFVILDIILGMLILATIVGNVGSMITNMNAAESEFLEKLDGVKQYMMYRRVGEHLRKRIIKWFGYIWSQKQSLDEGAILDALPTKLKAELAINVHLETLRRVRIFQDCDPGLLVELVLKLKLQVFSPGDYICRKGDVGKEMYIVKRGSLNVVGEDGVTVFVTLKEGSVFGELSVLNIPGNKTGNKRSASVRSVGYSDLFVLSKDDLWDALREYPEAKRMLLGKGREILRKDNLLNEGAPDEDEVIESLDQKLLRIERNLKNLELNFDGLYNDFAQQVAISKQRVTRLETTFKDNKKAIKKDIYRGFI